MAKPSTPIHFPTPYPAWIGLLSDLLLLGLIIFLISIGTYWFWIRPQQVTRQVININFNDANELSKGAIVRLMGTEIGYVQGIHLTPKSVQVTVETNPNAIQIPSGSMFTINFTGLVGAKSIEVIPPDTALPNQPDKAVYFVEEPIRLKQALDAQIEVAKALEKGAENFADFFGKQQPIPVLQQNVHTLDRKIVTASQTVANTDQGVQNIHRKLHGGFSKIQMVATDFTASSADVASVTGRNEFGPSLLNVVGDVSKGILQVQAEMGSFVRESRLEKMNRQTLAWNQRFANGKTYVASHPVLPNLAAQQQNLTTVSQALSQIQQSLNPTLALQQIQQANQAVLQFNQTLLGFEQKWNNGKQKNP